MSQEFFTPETLPQLPLKSKLPILGGTVLVSEAIIVYFALLVGYGLRPVSIVWLIAAAGVLGALCLVATLTLPRRVGQRRPGVGLGWLTQALILFSGIVLKGLFVVAAIFVPMWAVAVYWGRRIDREATAYAEQAHAAVAPEQKEK